MNSQQVKSCKGCAHYQATVLGPRCHEIPTAMQRGVNPYTHEATERNEDVITFDEMVTSDTYCGPRRRLYLKRRFYHDDFFWVMLPLFGACALVYFCRTNAL